MNETKYTNPKDAEVWRELIKTVKETSTDENRMLVIMCSRAFGNTPEELQLFGERIKEVTLAGGDVHVTN